MLDHGSIAGTGLTSEQIASVRAPLEQAAVLPAKVYSDPHIFQLERERIFGRSWLTVCHISQLPEPGSYVARTLIGEAVIAVRGRDGEIRVLSNVCRHRNTVLATGSGQCKGRLTCPYHGWAYGLDGKLLAAPFMDQAVGFSRRDIQLPEFRHEVWHGFVFVSFDTAAPSLAKQLASFEPHVSQYRLADMELFPLRVQRNSWNWKISLENFSEAYHQPWVHPQTAEEGFPARLAEYYDVDGPYSIFLLRNESGEKVKTFVPPVAGLEDRLMRSISVFNVYPYMHALADPASPLILDFNIKNENEHELIWSVLMPKGSRQSSEIDAQLKSFADFMDPIFAEDIGVCTGVGLGVQSRFTTQGRLSHMEKPIHQFHNWWLDRMLDAG